MKVGDLVSLKMKKTQPPQVPRLGVIVNTWTTGHTGRLSSIDILWGSDQDTQVRNYSPELFEVINAAS